MKISYSAAMSLDGYIARQDGDVSWLNEVEATQAEAGFARFFSSVDGLVMGRATYDFVLHYGTWPYEDKPAWVCTSGHPEPMAGALLAFVRTPQEAIAGAQTQSLNHLWLVGGGQLASSFLDLGLLTHLSLTELPIRLGEGIPLFAHHQWHEIPGDRNVIEWETYRQIEVDLSRPSAHG